MSTKLGVVLKLKFEKFGFPLLSELWDRYEIKYSLNRRVYLCYSF